MRIEGDFDLHSCGKVRTEVEGLLDGGGDEVYLDLTEVGFLDSSGLAARGGRGVTHRFVVSDDQPRFLQVGSRFLGERLAEAELVAVG